MIAVGRGGQSWAVYGLALCYHYTHEEAILPLFERVTKYFIDHLPEIMYRIGI